MYYNPNLTYPVPVHPTWDIQDGSKIKTYMECPRKYFYEYVLGWQSRMPSNHLIFGSAWHEALAHLYLTDFTPRNVLIAFNEKFLPTYRKDIDPGDDDLYWPKTPERALKALAYYVATYAGELSENQIMEYNGEKLIEIGGKINISKDYEVSFRQDAVVQNKQGIFSLEHKTLSSTYGWADQWYLMPSTAIYTHVLYCLFPPSEVAGIKYNGICFNKTKDDPKPTGGRYVNKDEKDPFRHFEAIRVPIYKNPENMGNMIVNLIYWLDMIKGEFDNLARAKSEDLYLNCYPQNWTSCKNWSRLCEYHDFCCNWRNPLRHIQELPLDLKVEFWNPLADDIRVEVNV